MTPPERSRTRPVKDELLLDALASGSRIKTAATYSGYSESTITRRLKDPGFQRRLQERRAERSARLNDRLESGADRAISVLIQKLNTGTDRDQIAAARALLQGVLSLRRLDLDAESDDRRDLFTELLAQGLEQIR